jgi:hypothetical protein
VHPGRPRKRPEEEGGGGRGEEVSNRKIGEEKEKRTERGRRIET